MTELPVHTFCQQETPFYYYDIDLLLRTISVIQASKPHDSIIHYALKANSNARILSLIAQSGLGADCVSGGEITLAVEAGISPDKIVYSGVGKTDNEIIHALEMGIDCFNVESLAELRVIDELAARCGKIAPIAFRVNPHIDAHTHQYITTGMSENKFGVDISLIQQLICQTTQLSNIRLRGLHFHIGSQILSLQPFAELCDTINLLLDKLIAAGIHIDYINVGGGLGVDYENPIENPIAPFQAYFDIFKNRLNLPHGCTLHFELGRAVVAQCGSLITRVLYVKQGLNKQFVIVDAGMTELIRPALYQAYHKIENLSSCASPQFYDVVGPVCESSDTFAHNIMLPVTQRGDIIAIRSAGAYAESMALRYNSRPSVSALFSK